MAYLGVIPAVGYSKIEKQKITGNGGTTYTLTYPVGSEQEIEVYVNNVRQEPGVAYTTLGTTLTMTGVVTASDSFYVVYQGKAEQIGSIIPEKQADGSYIFDSNVSVSGIITNGGNAVTPVTGFKNRIINGNFDFWQRGTSTSSVAYLADRWQNYADGSTFTSSRQAFTLGQTDVPGEPTYFHRSVVSSVAGAGNRFFLANRIESVRSLAGQTATLSFWAKADASKNMAVEFLQSFGTGGSPSSAVNAIGVTTCALTTAWKKFTITVNIPSISGKTLGSDNNDYLAINFWFDAGSNFNSRTNSLGQQSGTFDIAQVQLEAGPVATPFEQRPLGQELALCQRYYYVQTSLSYFDGNSGNSTVARGSAKFGVRMRAIPSITVYPGTNLGGTSGKAYISNTNGETSVTEVSTITVDGFDTITNSSNLPSTSYIYAISFTASAEL